MALTRLNTNAYGSTINLTSNVTGTLPTGNGGTGATSFAPGSLVKLQSQTASSSSTITFTSTYITSTYKVYQLHCIDVLHSSDGGNLGFQVSADNGSNFATATLVAMPDFATGIKMAKVNDLSVTAGTQLKYKIEFANQASGSKEARIRGVSLQY